MPLKPGGSGGVALPLMSVIHPAALLDLVAGIRAIPNATQYLSLVELDLVNQLTESEYIYGVGRYKGKR